MYFEFTSKTKAGRKENVMVCFCWEGSKLSTYVYICLLHCRRKIKIKLINLNKKKAILLYIKQFLSLSVKKMSCFCEPIKIQSLCMRSDFIKKCILLNSYFVLYYWVPKCKSPYNLLMFISSVYLI